MVPSKNATQKKMQKNVKKQIFQNQKMKKMEIFQKMKKSKLRQKIKNRKNASCVFCPSLLQAPPHTLVYHSIHSFVEGACAPRCTRAQRVKMIIRIPSMADGGPGDVVPMQHTYAAAACNVYMPRAPCNTYINWC